MKEVNVVKEVMKELKKKQVRKPFKRKVTEATLKVLECLDILKKLPKNKAIRVKGVAPSTVCSKVYELRKLNKTKARATIVDGAAVIYRG